jgi:hypothetical protein
MSGGYEAAGEVSFTLAPQGYQAFYFYEVQCHRFV